MRKFYLPILAFVFFQFSYSQEKLSYSSLYENYYYEDILKDTLPNDSLKTTVITIDLSRPHKNSVSHSGNKDRLVVKSRNPLSVMLINGNPFRYTYVLNYETINLFGTEAFELKPKQSNESESIKSINTQDTIKGNEEIQKHQDSLNLKIKLFKENLEYFISDLNSSDNLNYKSFKKVRREVFNDLEALKNENEKIANAITKSDSISDKIIKLQSENNKYISELDNLVSPLLKVVSDAYLLPIDINGDNIDYIQIKLQRIDNINSTTETYIYKIWVQGGLKIDVSGGAYITSLFDSEYTVTPVVNEDGSISNLSTITENNLGNYDFGFGAMVNISLRGGSWVRPTLNFGTLLTSNQKFQILSGVGLILGKNERWIIHGGLAMGEVSIIKNNYKADGTTSYDLGNPADVPVINRFKFGHFFGVSYNFSKPKTNED